MALSQIQCLDDNHVNPRTHESKPEFLYCEDQRLALEALFRDGREAFVKYLEARGLRGFLSDPELESLVGAMEPYDPGLEIFPGNAEDGETPLSLHYWPELSDTSIPQMDLGWPDSDSYRGVTRTTVYTQPPLDGQAHIKEVVRKMIAQAQKVIAVVMDVFTDVDIFRDLLDAGFKRRVSVYILLERTTLPHFLSMCQRANMHAGHLKHLRVRCTDGAEFYTRSCTKVKGRMGHRYMFIDGDKAVSGSYSFTWMSSRLDRNVITVVTGQAVDAFDRLFRSLYVTSSSVDLRQVAMEPEPEPEPLPQPAVVVPPSAAIARKLYNPKYALVALGSPNPTSSAGDSSPKDPPNPENSKNPDVPETNKRRQKRASKEAIQDVPPLHPGLTDLEKACLISYLPTWPEPDPPSDVIGFINIRDANKPTQVHLQRSEMFETSQAIRFRGPISMLNETLPEVAQPRQLDAKHTKMDKLQPTQDKNKAGESVVNSVQPTLLSAERGSIISKEDAPEQKTEPAKDTTKVLTTENKLHSNTPTSQDAGCNATLHLSTHTHPQSSSKASTPNNHRPSDATQTINTNSPKPESLPGSNTQKEAETSLNTQNVVVHRTQTLESSSTQSPHLHAPSNTERHTQEKTGLPLTNSHIQPQNSSEITPNLHAPTVHSHISTSSTSQMHSQSVSSISLSENNHTPITTSITTNACASLSSIVSSSLPHQTSSTTLHSPLPSSTTSSPLTPTPPIPKPRTVQLVIKHGNTSDGQNLPEISVVRRTESLASTVVYSKPDVANVVQTPPEKEPETVQELHNSKTGAQKNNENTGNPEEAPKQNVASQETKSEEAVGLHDNTSTAETQAQSNGLITDAPKEDSENIQEIIPKEVDPKSLTSTDCKITSKTQTVQTATIQTDTKAPSTDCEFAQVPNEKSNNMTQHIKYHEPQTISNSEIIPQDKGALETVNSLKSATHNPATTHSHIPKDSADDSTNIQRGNPSATSAPHTDSTPNMAKHNTHINITSQESKQTPKPPSSHTPERPLRLHLSDTHIRDLRSPTSERELRSLTALTPTPDGFPPRTPTPDSQTRTPDPRSYTPDFRTPTPDVSDGYVSPREDSALSTTSEEYYECMNECNDSPFHDPVFDCVGYRNHGMTEDHVSFTHTNTPNATTITTTSTSPTYINNSTHAAKLGTADRNTSSSETQSLSGPVRVSSSSSLLEKKEKMTGEEETANEENEREEDERGRTEQGSQETERRGNDESKKTTDYLRQHRDLTEKDQESQAPKRKRGLNKPGTERLIGGGVTLGNSTNEGTGAKQMSTGGLIPDNGSSEGERPDKEKVVDKVALRPSGVDKKDKHQSTRESDGQKVSHTTPKLSRGQQQQDSGSSSPSRPPRPLPPFSTTQCVGTRPWGSHQLNQAESKVLHGSFQVLDNTSSPRRPPPRPPPPVALAAVRSAAGQKQANMSHSQHRLLSRQPLAAQVRARVGQSQNQHPYLKPQSSFLLTQPNMHLQLHPHSHNQIVSVQEAHRQEEAKSPFTITFGRLYNLQGLKDKMSKLPSQSKRGSSSVQGRKSSS